MRRVAILTPLKGEVPACYHTNMGRILSAKLGIAVANIIVEGIGIQWARNIAVFRAKKLDCDEVIFIDKDLDVPLEAFERILSYEHEKIVCGVYSHRKTDGFFHGKRWSDDEAKPNPKGLWRMWQCAIGFCKIRMSVFDTLAARNPDRVGLMATDGYPEPVEMPEYFPMELVGPNTPAGRLAKIKNIINQPDYGSPLSKIDAINIVLNEKSPEPNVFLSEDYGWCRLVRDAGIEMFMDPHLMVQHEARIKVPIDTEELVRMLKEPWRTDLPQGVVLP